MIKFFDDTSNKTLNDSITSADDAWNPDYNKIASGILSNNSIEDKPMALYEAALKLTNQKKSKRDINPDGSSTSETTMGDWETTENIDKDFSKLINEAKNINPDINLDNYSDEKWLDFGDTYIGKSGGQKYRDERITPQTNHDVLTDVGNAINGLNYNIAKPIAGAIKQIPGIGKEIGKHVSADNLMLIPSAIEDLAVGKLGAIGGAALGGLAGAGAGAAPGAIAGAVAAPFAKGFLENKQEFDAADSETDPVTGRKYNQDEINRIRNEARWDTALTTANGALGNGVIKVLQLPKIGKVENIVEKIGDKIPDKLGSFFNNLTSSNAPGLAGAFTGFNPVSPLQAGTTAFATNAARNSILKNLISKSPIDYKYASKALPGSIGENKTLSNILNGIHAWEKGSENVNDQQQIYNDPEYQKYEEMYGFKPNDTQWITRKSRIRKYSR